MFPMGFPSSNRLARRTHEKKKTFPVTCSSMAQTSHKQQQDQWLLPSCTYFPRTHGMQPQRNELRCSPQSLGQHFLRSGQQTYGPGVFEASCEDPRALGGARVVRAGVANCQGAHEEAMSIGDVYAFLTLARVLDCRSLLPLSCNAGREMTAMRLIVASVV